MTIEIMINLLEVSTIWDRARIKLTTPGMSILHPALKFSDYLLSTFLYNAAI